MAYNAFDVRNADARNRDYAMRRNAYDQRAAPKADFRDALAARQQGMQSRDAQGRALALAEGAANGTAPSVADARFVDALAASQRQQASIAASARGGGLGRAAAQRMGAQNAADMTPNAAAQSAALRAQEMSDARAQFAGISSQMRGNDLAQQGQDASQAQFQTTADLQNRAINDQMVSNYENQRTQLATQQYQGQLARQGAIDNAVGQHLTQKGIDHGISVANNQRTDSYIAAGANTVGRLLTLASMSDERVKTDVRSGDGKVASFLDALNAADYRYKNPGQPGEAPGRHTSVMAQDLEKSELGRRMVHETPQGKAIDYREGFATMLASLAKVNSDVSKLKDAFAARSRRGT